MLLCTDCEAPAFDYDHRDWESAQASPKRAYTIYRAIAASL